VLDGRNVMKGPSFPPRVSTPDESTVHRVGPRNERSQGRGAIGCDCDRRVVNKIEVLPIAERFSPLPQKALVTYLG
jgi:hypothetical protein